MATSLATARWMVPLLAYLRRNAIKRGLFDGARVWQVVGLILLSQKFLRRYGGKTVEKVAVENLKPGDAIQITAIDPRSLRHR